MKKAACRRVGCRATERVVGEREDSKREKGGRILSDAGRRGAACVPVALQPPPQLRPERHFRRATFLSWSRLSSSLFSFQCLSFRSVPGSSRRKFEIRETRFPSERNEAKRNGDMLIGLVRDSVLQCFCHSCKAPLGIVGE